MERILAIQVKQIGDVLLTLPALRALKRKKPEAEITFVIRPEASGLIPMMPFVDRVITHGFFKAPLNFLKCGALRFDSSLDFSGNDRASAYTFFSGADTRATYNKFRQTPLRKFYYNASVKSQIKEQHVIDYHLNLLGILDIHTHGEPLILSLPASLLQERNQIAEKYHIANKYAIVHPGTARSEKYWEPHLWARVIRRLLTNKQAKSVVITGGNDRAERAHVDKIHEDIGDLIDSGQVVDLSGKLSLSQSAALISECRVAVGVDTAAMHIASGFQRPQVVLFGPTNPFHWGPRHRDALVVMPGIDEPLPQYKYPEEASETPMSELSTETVFRAIDQLYEVV